MKASKLLKLLENNLDPDFEVHCIEETQTAITVNVHGGPESFTTYGKCRIIVKDEEDWLPTVDKE